MQLALYKRTLLAQELGLSISLTTCCQATCLNTIEPRNVICEKFLAVPEHSFSVADDRDFDEAVTDSIDDNGSAAHELRT